MEPRRTEDDTMRGLAYFFTRSPDGHGWEAWAEDHYGARMYLGWAP
jgi:hypothetical protein